MDIVSLPYYAYTLTMEISTDESHIQQIRSWLGTGSINIFGYPFAGKDTQGGTLAAELEAPLIGGGDILRNSIIPDRVKAIMDSGALIPTEDYMQIVLPYLAQEKFEGKPLMLSSVGRWTGEEHGVIEATAQSGHPIKAVIQLHLDERTVWSRFQSLERDAGNSRGQRHDDDADKIETRLEEYRVKTLPVIEFYRSLGLVIDIDSDKPITEVRSNILSQLADFAAKNP